MDNIKGDRYYLSKIFCDVSFVILHTQKLSLEEFSADEVLIDSVMFRMVQIAENAQKLSVEFKKRHCSVDWSAINGLRNRIVHDYGKVDLSIIYHTVKFDLPNLKEILNEI